MKRQPRKLHLETLETREVCAGDVKAVLVGDTVVITGDTKSNYIDIQQKTVDSNLTFVIRGKSFDGQFTSAGDPVLAVNKVTSINGSSAPVEIAGQKLSINMKAGNDAVVIGSTSGEKVQGASFRIVTGVGRDYVRMSNTRFDKVGDADVARIDTTGAGGLTAKGQNELGADKVVIQSMVLSNLGLFLATGGGNDRINVNGYSLFGGTEETIVNTGNGADALAVSFASLVDVSVNTGAGAQRDVVTAKSVSARDATVIMGGGNGDLLNLTSQVQITRKVVLNGGPGGSDTIKAGSNVKIPKDRTITGFETVPNL